MRPATMPPAIRDDVRLLVVDGGGSLHDRSASDLPSQLRAGDLLVLNDAATLPAALPGHAPPGHGPPGHGPGAPLEIRLLAAIDDRRWHAVVMGPGDWRARTEDRPAPPRLRVGDVLALGPLRAQVLAVSPAHPRLLELMFDRAGEALWDALYRHGRPVQYSYLEQPLALWSVQTVYGGRPWAVEMPSAGRPLSWQILLEVRRAGVELAVLTHAAGLSSTGDPALDAALPLPERYEIPDATVDAIERTRARGGGIVAVGTTVVRALEGAARQRDGRLRAGAGITDLRIDALTHLHVVDAILTGMHAPGESHYRLLHAFADRSRLDSALAHAIAAGYRTHEFGDLCLLWRAG